MTETWPERIGGALPRLVTRFRDWDARHIDRGTERRRRRLEEARADG